MSIDDATMQKMVEAFENEAGPVRDCYQAMRAAVEAGGLVPSNYNLYTHMVDAQEEADKERHARERAERENKALREALKPFAQFACDESHVDEPDCHNCRARRVLAAFPQAVDAQPDKADEEAMQTHNSYEVDRHEIKKWARAMIRQEGTDAQPTGDSLRIAHAIIDVIDEADEQPPDTSEMEWDGPDLVNPDLEPSDWSRPEQPPEQRSEQSGIKDSLTTDNRLTGRGVEAIAQATGQYPTSADKALDRIESCLNIGDEIFNRPEGWHLLDSIRRALEGSGDEG